MSRTAMKHGAATSFTVIPRMSDYWRPVDALNVSPKRKRRALCRECWGRVTTRQVIRTMRAAML